MYYVEMLRAWRVLRIFLIILGAVFVLCTIGRLSGHGSLNVNDYSVPSNARHVMHTVSSDGTRTTSFDDKRGEHVVIRSDPHGAQTIAITAPTTAKSGRAQHAHMGIVSLTQTQHGKLTTTVMRNTNAIPLDILFLSAGFFVAIFASILGLSLSQENDGHLELAWTKPIRREGYAGVLIAADICAMLALLLITVLTAIAILAMYGVARELAADRETLSAVGFTLAFFFSFYAISMAATASLRRASAVALAILWPAALILPNLSAITWLNIGVIVRAIDTLNPIAYFYAMTSSWSRPFTFVPLGLGYAVAAMAIIAVAGLLASIGQWRRLEA